MLSLSSQNPLNARSRGRIRSLPLYVSLAPGQSPSTAPSEIKDSQDVNIRPNKESNATTSTTSVDHIVNGSTSIALSPVEVVNSHRETDEQHMNQVRVGDDVEVLTHLSTHDQFDLQRLVSPSIPISYDDHGMVQADFNPAMAMDASTNGFAVTPDGAMTIAINNEPEYPQFIQVLYRKDSNGQTLASKLFNGALLAMSFGYIFLSVVNIDHGMTRGWSPAEIGMRIPLDTWASYENSLSEKPVATKTIINIVIYLLGDWLSQTIFQKKDVLDFDAARTLKNGFIGMCFGPVVHEYYEFSDWILPVDGLTIGITNRAFKILMDQTIYLSVKCSIYILAIGVLNGASVEDSSENVKNRLKPIMFAAWKFWPLVHCVTYGLIPARHRILWVNSVDLVWNAILASKARDDGDEDEEETMPVLDEQGSDVAKEDEGVRITNFIDMMKSKFGEMGSDSHESAEVGNNMQSTPVVTGEDDFENGELMLETKIDGSSDATKIVSSEATTASKK